MPLNRGFEKLRFPHFPGGRDCCSSPMSIRRRKIPLSESMKEAIEEAGGEPFDSSGFENEQPDEQNASGRAPSPSKSAGTRAEG